MKSYIYKHWDGTQTPFSLKKKDIIDKFMDNILKGMTPEMSLAQMLWKGFPLGGMDFKIMSLEEMVNDLQQKMYDLFSSYSLEKAFDDPMNDIKNFLADEALTCLDHGAQMPPSYEDLPTGLYEKLRFLDGTNFLNENSKETYTYWKTRQKDILDLYEFYSKYYHHFTGSDYLNFDQAVELMRQFQAIKDLQQQILSGQLRSIDLNTLKELLGEDAEKSFIVLLQLPELLSDDKIIKIGANKIDMTPRGMRALGEMAFGKLYHQIKKDRQGGHHGNAPESGEIEPDSSRPYQFGDRFDLDITRTMLKAVSQTLNTGGAIRLSPGDFYVRQREQLITSTTVVLLDLSWSMSFGGRFEAGKRVAIALDHYIRTRFPKDKIHIIGFSTVARELKGDGLSNAVWDTKNPHTNLQDGLRLAMKFIKKSGNRNNRVLVITDGQPTAYYDERECLHVEMPFHMFGLSHNASRATLAEVRKVTANGMNIEIFLLDNSPVLVEFTKQICRINRGRSMICLPNELGRLIMVEEINRRGGRI
ncbi:MAG: VWA domain-containing protein [Spirochaetota bacterium]|nr:VWA domain-containing protein [Spirochaetota bacterium]